MNKYTKVPAPRWWGALPGLALLLVLLALPMERAKAQGEGPLFMSRVQCIQFALNNHPNIKNARFDEAIAAARVKELTGIGLPQLSGKFEIQDNAILPTSVVPANQFNPFAPEDSLLELKFGVQWQASAGISLYQMIFDGSFFVGLEAARKFKDLTVLSTRRTEEETAANVSQAYYTALISRERSKLLDVNVDRLRNLEENTRALYEAGFVEKIDVDRITINLQNLKVEKQKVENLLALSENLLKFQMGMDLNQTILLTDTLERPETLPNMPEMDYQTQWHEKRIEYTLLKEQENIQNLNLKRYKVGRIPSAGLFANYSFQAPRTSFNFLDFNRKWYPFFVVGVTVNVPIWDGGQTSGRIQQVENEIMKIQNNRVMLEQAISLEVRNAGTSLVNNYMTLKNAAQTLTLAEEVYRITRIKFEEGVGSNLEVLEAESTLRESQTNYLTSLYEYMMAKTDLEKARGQILPQAKP